MPFMPFATRLLLFTLLPALLPALLRADSWHVPESDLRLEYRIISQPSRAEGGFFLRVPDSGLIPPNFEAQAFDETGQRLNTVLVWHNRAVAAGLVVAAPQRRTNKIFLYLKPGASTPGWNPRHQDLRPGPFLFTEEHPNPSLRIAQALGEEIVGMRNPTEKALMDQVRNLHYEKNPFGRDSSYVSYFTAWLDIKETGEYYFGTISNAGSVVRINGSQIVRIAAYTPRREIQRAQRGGTVQLREGLHRVEYEQFFESRGTPEMLLAWRTPSMSRDDLPAVVPPSAFVRSGDTILADALSQKGLSGENPLGQALERKGVIPAVIEFDPVAYLWLDQGKPMFLYSLRAWNHGRHPPGTRYQWFLNDALISEASDFDWIFEGNERRNLRLEVSNSAGTSKVNRQVFHSDPPRRANVNNARQRRDFRRALINHLQAAQKGGGQAWTQAYLNMVPEVIEPLQDDGLVALLIETRPDSLAQLPAAKRHLLEDSLFIASRRDKPENAREHAESFRRQSRDPERTFHWDLELVRLRLYEFDQATEALEDLHRVSSGNLTAEQRFRLHLLRGDIYRHQGQFDQADQAYREAQQQRPEGERSRRTEIPQWRETTVRTASYFNRIRQMVNDGFYAEARELLREWEWETPRQRANGDFIVAEASFYLALKDYRRALAIAEVLRRRHALDNFLPSTVSIEARAMEALKDVAGLEKLLEAVGPLIPGHEVIDEVRGALRNAR